MDAPSKWYFDIRFRWFGHTPVLEVLGELDFSSRSGLRDGLVEAFERGSKRSGNMLVLNFTECSFMDSEGLKVLLEANSQLSEEGGVVRVVVPDSCSVARTFQATSEYHGFTVYQNVSEAIRASGEDSAFA